MEVIKGCWGVRLVGSRTADRCRFVVVGFSLVVCRFSLGCPVWVVGCRLSVCGFRVPPLSVCRLGLFVIEANFSKCANEFTVINAKQKNPETCPLSKVHRRGEQLLADNAPKADKPHDNRPPWRNSEAEQFQRRTPVRRGGTYPLALHNNRYAPSFLLLRRFPRHRKPDHPQSHLNNS